MKIIYENEEGGVSIITPVINEIENLTIEEIAAKDVPGNTPFEIVNDMVLPADRSFRNAWVKNVKKIIIDMPKARLIHMDIIRRSRNSDLEASDKELVRAMEDGADLTPIKAKRQKLRDIPQKFDLSEYNTPQTLKTAWPDNLSQGNEG